MWTNVDLAVFPTAPQACAPVPPASLGPPDRHGGILRLLASFPRELRGWGGPAPIRRTQAAAPDVRAGAAPPTLPPLPHRRLLAALGLAAIFLELGTHAPKEKKLSKINTLDPSPLLKSPGLQPSHRWKPKMKSDISS